MKATHPKNKNGGSDVGDPQIEDHMKGRHRIEAHTSVCPLDGQAIQDPEAGAELAIKF